MDVDGVRDRAIFRAERDRDERKAEADRREREYDARTMNDQERALGRIRAWASHYKDESRSGIRETMKLVYEEAEAALVSTDDLIEQDPNAVADVLIAAVAGAGYAAGAGEMFRAPVGPRVDRTSYWRVSPQESRHPIRRRAVRCSECRRWTTTGPPRRPLCVWCDASVPTPPYSGVVLLPAQPAVRARKATATLGARKARKAKPERLHTFGKGPVESSLDNLLRELDWLTRHPDEQTDEQMLSIGRHAQRDLKTIQGRRARARRAVRRRGRMGRATVEKRMTRLLAEIERVAA